MFTQFYPEPERNELVVELKDKPYGGAFSFVVHNEETGKTIIQFEENGRVWPLRVTEKLELPDQAGLAA